MADDIVGDAAQTGGSLLSKAWKATKVALPLLAISTVVAAYTGGISLGLDAAAATAAGDSIAATGAASVSITPGTLAQGVWDGLVHNVSNIGEFLKTAFGGAQAALAAPAIS